MLLGRLRQRLREDRQLLDKNGDFINLAYDVCVFANLPPTCSGGGVGGGLLGGGNSEIFDLTLVANDGTWTLPTTLDHFLIKYQGEFSFEIPGTPDDDVGDDDIPEPSTLLLFATGLIVLGVLNRRRRWAA